MRSRVAAPSAVCCHGGVAIDHATCVQGVSVLGPGRAASRMALGGSRSRVMALVLDVTEVAW